MRFRQVFHLAPMHLSLQSSQAFVRSLVNMSVLDKDVLWKNQPGDEIHKIFTVVRRSLAPAVFGRCTHASLDCRKIPGHGQVPV